jgi:hypothetical protein
LEAGEHAVPAEEFSSSVRDHVYTWEAANRCLYNCHLDDFVERAQKETLQDESAAELD